MQTIYCRIFATIGLSVFSVTAFAQEKRTISGTVRDGKNGELVIGATVKVVEDPSVNVVANEYGFYSISLPQGNYTIAVAYGGFENYRQTVQLDQNVKLDLILNQEKERTAQIDEYLLLRPPIQTLKYQLHERSCHPSAQSGLLQQIIEHS